MNLKKASLEAFLLNPDPFFSLQACKKMNRKSLFVLNSLISLTIT